MSEAVSRMRTLGSSGPNLAPLGIGTWIMGGAWRMGWGPQQDDESIRTLHDAWDRGINWVDTAPIYGLGHAEELTGRALAGRDDVLVFTKCGMQWDAAGHLGAIDLRPDAIRAECEASLRRLDREVIDLYQLHFPDPTIPIEESWGTMAELVDEGRVRWVGLSNHSVDEVRRAHALRPVDSVQARLHLLDQRNTVDLLPWCQHADVGVLAYSPLASGLLAGPVQRSTLAHDDWRREDARFALEQRGASDVLAAMQRLAPGQTTATAAIAWVVAQSGVTAAIVGARSTDELVALEAAANLTLTPEVVRTLAESAGEVAFEERPQWR